MAAVAKTSRDQVQYKIKMVDLRELTGYMGEVSAKAIPSGLQTLTTMKKTEFELRQNMV